MRATTYVGTHLRKLYRIYSVQTHTHSRSSDVRPEKPPATSVSTFEFHSSHLLEDGEKETLVGICGVIQMRSLFLLANVDTKRLTHEKPTGGVVFSNL